MVELGKLSPKEALTHPARGEVSQAVGGHYDLQPASHRVKLSPGDWLLLACDGLHAHVDNRGLQEEVARSAPSASYLARRLVELVNQKGGSDNCTVLAAYCC